MGSRAVDAQELRQRIRELLVPNDEPIGEPGRRADIRLLHGDLGVAEEFFHQLQEMGEVEALANYSGWLVRLGNEGRASRCI